jgi:putative ABC transport system permease protein
VSPGYFTAAGTTLHEGRDLSAADRDGAVPVAVIDEAMRQRLAQETPGPILGRQLDVTVHEFRAGYSVTRRTVEVVGVVGDIPHEHPDAPPPGTIYLPHAQYPLWSMAVVMRGGGASVAAARAVVNEMNPDLPLIAPRPLTAVVDNVLAPTRFVLAMAGVFALVAIGLAAAGLYGLLAEAVRQRRREFGIRLAIGAAPGALTEATLRSGLVLVAIGLAPGLALVFPATRMIGRAVMTTGGVSLAAVGAATVGVLLVAAAACYGPARRAGRVDPLVVLREE